MAAAKKSETKSAPTTRLWVNCSVRKAAVQNYGAYERVTPELKKRSGSAGFESNFDHTYEEVEVEPFEAIEVPADVSLLSKSRGPRGQIKRDSRFSRDSFLHAARVVDHNVGFLPAAEESDEELIVPVIYLHEKTPKGPIFQSIVHVENKTELTKEDLANFKSRLPAKISVGVAKANRNFKPFAGNGRHSEEQAFAVIAAMQDEGAIQAYLQRDPRQRVQIFGSMVAKSRRLEAGLRAGGAVERQKDALRLM